MALSHHIRSSIRWEGHGGFRRLVCYKGINHAPGTTCPHPSNPNTISRPKLGIPSLEGKDSSMRFRCGNGTKYIQTSTVKDWLWVLILFWPDLVCPLTTCCWSRNVSVVVSKRRRAPGRVCHLLPPRGDVRHFCLEFVDQNRHREPEGSTNGCLWPPQSLY